MPHRSLQQSSDGNILNLLRLPARLNGEHAAKLLGFALHDIPVLVADEMLHPLGRPTANATKYFAREEILHVSRDPKWLSKATQKIYEHWKTKNARKLGSVLCDGHGQETVITE